MSEEPNDKPKEYSVRCLSCGKLGHDITYKWEYSYAKYDKGWRWREYTSDCKYCGANLRVDEIAKYVVYFLRNWKSESKRIGGNPIVLGILFFITTVIVLYQLISRNIIFGY